MDMSKQNKVNPGQYTQAGRLSPDDVARERGKQDVPPASGRSGSGQKAVPTGISNRESAEEEQQERERLPAAQDRSRSTDARGDDAGADRAVSTDNEQTSSKSGSRSSAQKAAESKYVNQPHPASEKVEGAFGRESDD
jgi:hypothetical protein